MTGPSALYRGGLWRAATMVARGFPARRLASLAKGSASLYGFLNRNRREIVVENLLPVTNDRPAAEACARRLFNNFGQKLADLWQYEAGVPIDSLMQPASYWERLVAVTESKRGLLLVTPHLGNWEFGAPLLTRKGVPLLVLTRAEPHDAFTAARDRARRQWGVETLVVGEDPFAFVEVIRRLERGAAVALLIDRPAPSSAVGVTLFERPFRASVAAAELARATGCALLPVILPRHSDGYHGEILPEIPYDRAKINTRDARIALTQQIVRAFEPSIRQYLDQWYHFVPVWDAPPSS